MDDIYVLILEQEDYTRVYGIFTTYIEAETQKAMLLKYNESCNYGELHIYSYKLNTIYTNTTPDFII